ncbi:hypothetical protein BCR34DRAFT_587872 [Clohesyomyces aquaticus]|uniref:SMP-LTD domain-containing protein n=1 Tax=Clohesyomyces aquaticus TaxID=1231657 RepID=A0A1Y1ZMQ3_9PLEO|nr:hypothetical protein BCR34DRAFT_587872 [Clohesyomyces aquaticus]
MASLTVLAVVYLTGGLTFLPLLLGLIFLHAYFTLPIVDEAASNRVDCAFGDKQFHPTGDSSHTDLDNLPPELKPRTHVPDVAAGYFAVCREFVPGGINGKPPERVTPVGTVVATGSPSVYQSMYRSIFDRTKTSSPTMDGPGGKIKKARNVFYVVLRHRHLMLYDDSEQLEVRHVISLAHYEVDIYAGGNIIPEGELWIKRNCIRLVQRAPLASYTADSKPFYFFSENCSEKEDFYHAMLHCQERGSDSSGTPPLPLQFDTSDLVKLVQQLHVSEESLHTRWINALIGRLFLSLYKTSEVEQFIRAKITKKIARVPKPALISGISLRKVNMGNLPPFITNPKLREFTVDGDLTVEADVSYKGNFRLEIAAVARIELGSRFKAREVTLILAGILKKLEGHVLVRIKPPPTNRLWITFESAPKMELLLEPIVSSRQITYGVILRAIESRIREVINETLVLPNWDDIPFSDTAAHQFRGGIWTQEWSSGEADTYHDHAFEQNMTGGEKAEDAEGVEPASLISDEKVQSQPVLKSASETRGAMEAKMGVLSAHESEGLSSATDLGVGLGPGARPRVIRPGSFAKLATPIVNMNTVSAATTQDEARLGQQDAATTMKIISNSQPTTPIESPAGSPPRSAVLSELSTQTMPEKTLTESDEHIDQEDSVKVSNRMSAPHDRIRSPGAELSFDSSGSPDDPMPRHEQSMSLPRNAFSTAEKRQIFNQSFNSATNAAKKWFASRQNQDLPSPSSMKSSHSLHMSAARVGTLDGAEGSHLAAARTSTLPTQPQPSSEMKGFPRGSPAQPIGRGQPLPPPGTPLPPPPKPEKRTGWSVPNPANLATFSLRKPLQTNSAQPSEVQKDPFICSSIPSHVPGSYAGGEDNAAAGKSTKPSRRKSSSTLAQSVTAPPLPPRRKRLSTTATVVEGSPRAHEGLLVVEAPLADTSAPTSPLEELYQTERAMDEPWPPDPWRENGAQDEEGDGGWDDGNEGSHANATRGTIS